MFDSLHISHVGSLAAVAVNKTSRHGLKPSSFVTQSPSTLALTVVSLTINSVFVTNRHVIQWLEVPVTITILVLNAQIMFVTGLMVPLGAITIGIKESPQAWPLSLSMRTVLNGRLSLEQQQNVLFAKRTINKIILNQTVSGFEDRKDKHRIGLDESLGEHALHTSRYLVLAVSEIVQDSANGNIVGLGKSHPKTVISVAIRHILQAGEEEIMGNFLKTASTKE